MSEQKQIAAGDVVQLKSGSPWMTVQRTEDGLNLRCAWFGGDPIDHKTGVFAVAGLRLVTEEEKRERAEQRKAALAAAAAAGTLPTIIGSPYEM